MDRSWTKQYDPDVPRDLVLQDRTVLDLFEDAAARFPDRPALTLKGKTLTYAELRGEVERFAGALAGLGVGKDSRVALWLPNVPPMVIGFLAALRLGAQVVPTNPLYVERELEHQLNDAGVSVVVTLDFLWMGRLRGMLARTSVRHVVVTSIPDYLPFPLKQLAPLKLKKTGQWAKVPREPNVHSFVELVRTGRPAPAARLAPGDLAVLQYTGGTTGVAKGAMLTHRNLSANVQQNLVWFPTFERGREVALGALPYFHVFGMTCAMLFPLALGTHIVLAPNPRDIADLISSIARYRVTLFPAVPAQFIAILAHPRAAKADMTSVKGCFSGSAPLPVDVIERFEKMTGATITEGFGMTEASPVTHVNPFLGKRKPGTVGIPVPGTDMRVVDIETGERELPPGREGELCVRGPQVMKGYWNRPDETEKTIRDGWLYTGDLALIDPDGYCTIVGRKKDLIIVSGYNVYPDEVDRVLAAHPAVLESGTIGVPDVKQGEAVKSFIVLRPGASAAPADIVAHCREQLAAYKVPKLVELVPELPKSALLKVLRRDLRARERAQPGLEARGGARPQPSSARA